MNGKDSQHPAPPLSSGAQYYRCALQVNPAHYAQTYRGAGASLSEAEYANALVAKAADLGITVLAVTDHNHVEGVAAIREAAATKGIHVFPGFEVGSQEGIHVLCIYPLDCPADKLGRFLGELKIRNTAPSSQLSGLHFSELLETVHNQGGVSIAAHAVHKGGLLNHLSGQSRAAAWRDKHILAIQIPGSVDSLPQEYRKIVRNKNPDYQRDHAAGENLALAVVNAKDVESPETLDDPAASCWIKMSEVGIEGLRQAFLDPDSRIRLNSDPAPNERMEFIALSWEGGFLDGVTINFNSDINVMIGGRGAGKSTLVESLRYVLGLAPLDEYAKNAHQGIVKDVLKSGTKVSLRIRSIHPTERIYTIERTVPNPSVVLDSDGRTSNRTPADLLPGVGVYGQHEISGFTRDQGKLTSLLARFMEQNDELEEQKSELKRELKKSRQQLLDLQSDKQRIDEMTAALPGLKETLEEYRKSGIEHRLQDKSILVREERILLTLTECLRPLQEVLDTLRRELPVDRAFLSEKALAETSSKDLFQSAHRILDSLGKTMDDIAAQISAALQTADKDIAAIREQWKTHANSVEAAYEKTLRDLQKSHVDGAEFIRLREQIEKLQPLLSKGANLNEMYNASQQRRSDLLSAWAEVKAQEFRSLGRAAKKIGKKLEHRVRVAVQESGDRGALVDVLREELGGRLQETEARLLNASAFSLSEFATACRAGSEALREKYAFSAAQAKRISAMSPETLMRIEEMELPHKTVIELNVASVQSPEWKALEKLSTGQKATAVLLLLLLESDAPLVVDQPEDDLDNRFITEGVVPRMREAKRKRQFVFSTHNANIPVLGDAELILGLSASGNNAEIRPGHRGSIDSNSVRDLVEEVLEGGKDAFETRRRKYGF